jgi:ketosteroid isomerase-like protein
MLIRLFSIIAAASITFTSTAMGQAQSAAAVQCATSGSASAPELHKEWILVGWDKPTIGQSWVFREKLGKYYDWEANDAVLYDDMAPDYRIARSPEEYRSLFEPSFQALRRANHLVLNGPETVFGDELATSTLEFAGRLEPADSQSIIAIRTRSSIVWRCTNGDWKIFREHNSSRRITPAESQKLFGF